MSSVCRLLCCVRYPISTMAPAKRTTVRKKRLLQGQQTLSFGVKSQPSEAGSPSGTSEPSAHSSPGRGTAERGETSRVDPPARRGRSEGTSRSRVRPSDPGGSSLPVAGISSAAWKRGVSPPVDAGTSAAAGRRGASSPAVVGTSAAARRRGAVAGCAVVRPRRKCSTRRLGTDDQPPDYDTGPEPETSEDEDDFPLWSPTQHAKGEYV